MNNVLNVLYQFDENYAPFAAVSITSLLENNKDVKIIIYILEEKITEGSKERIINIAKKYNRQISFINTEPLVELMEQIGIPKYRGSYATNFKMFLTEVLPEGINRIIYIDSDTLVVGSLRGLIDRDMEGCPIGMVLDSLGNKHAKLIGLTEEDYYVNGGVILYDISKWIECKCTERIIEYTQNVRAHFMSPDQDILNLVLRGQIYVLEPQYNLQPVHKVYAPKLYRKFWKWRKYYNDEMIQQAVNAPVILHCFRYLGQFPWHKETLHPNVKEFDYYLKKTEWSDYEKTDSNMNGIVFKIERKLYKILPQSLFLVIFKLSYNYFIWKANRDSLNNQNSRNM